VSYLSDQRQYAQIDERSSERINVSFRLPQLSILGPVLFNLYVNDVTEGLPTEVRSDQYANNATIYTLCKPSELHHCQAEK